MSLEANLDASDTAVSGYNATDPVHDMASGAVTPDFQTTDQRL